MDRAEIQKLIEEFLLCMGVAQTSVEVVDQIDSDSPVYIIRTTESGILIGKQGEHFSALKHVLKRIIQKRMNAEEVKFNLDVNDYQARLLLDLKNKIKIMGDRALSFKVDIELEPMSSYERMIAHSFFSDSPELSTESVGQGKDRRVVIRYTPNKQKADSDLK